MSRPVFEAPAGRITGRRDGSVVRATGIRYARAARFAVPVAEPASSEPVDATRWSPACPQVDSVVTVRALGPVYAGLEFDEDCLRLSVTLPGDLAEGERLPVMIWLHGGSYTTGAADIPGYDPTDLVTEQRVVVVGVTYRLGLLGYLAGPGRPANLGLLDQLEALRWVRSNITAFGGDPDLVTLFGESAGGDAIAHLMIADGAAGLFRRAIMASPPLGIATGRDAMSQAMSEVAGRIEPDAPVGEVLARQAEVARAAAPFRRTSGMPFGTQYGHVPLPAETDLDDAWAAVAPDVDVLIGSNTQEASVFLPLTLGPVAALSPALRAAAVRVLTWMVYDRGIDAFARRHARAGGTAYRYRFGFAPPGSPYGACHMLDVPFLLGDGSSWDDAAILGDVTREETAELGAGMRRTWADFARTGTVAETPHALSVRRVS